MMSLKKVLFLDIDGVLNRAEYGKDLYNETYADYCACLHRPSVAALRKLLLDDLDLKIVWTSDWAKDRHMLQCDTDCCLSPLVVLEKFSWLKSRVFANVFYGNYSDAYGDAKMLAVKAFIEDYMVESYAIVDDDTYTKTPNVNHLFNHFVSINPLKSLLEDDLPLVKSKLALPMDGETMHSVLLHLESKDSFVINNRYSCRFDFSKHYGRKAPLFTEFKKDLNCPRLSAEVDVLVYDMKEGEHLQGKVSLNIDEDLNRRKGVSLCLKHLDDSSWMCETTAIHITDIVRAVA